MFQYVDATGTTVSALAEPAGMRKQGMAELVRYLEEKNYLSRQPDPSDGRAKLVLLTDRGREVIDIAQALVPEIEARAEAVLGPGRLAALAGDLTALHRMAVDLRADEPSRETRRSEA